MKFMQDEQKIILYLVYDNVKVKKRFKFLNEVFRKKLIKKCVILMDDT